MHLQHRMGGMPIIGVMIMFGDLILKLKVNWKQFWCVHDYKYTYHINYGQQGFDIYQCIKCGKRKTEEGFWMGYTGSMVAGGNNDKNTHSRW